jgi:hypothetical protein
VHDQFEYSYAPAPRAETFATPVSLEPAAAGAPAQAFSFLELFVPRRFANVEIVPPQAVTAEIQASCWDHPYHTPGARFSCQAPVDPDAAWRPLAGAPHLEVRDAATWTPSAGLVATWILRPAAGAAGDAAVRTAASVRLFAASLVPGLTTLAAAQDAMETVRLLNGATALCLCPLSIDDR